MAANSIEIRDTSIEMRFEDRLRRTLDEERTHSQWLMYALDAAAHDASSRVLVWRLFQKDIAERSGDLDLSWNALSAPSFARDWESEEDQVYDDLP